MVYSLHKRKSINIDAVQVTPIRDVDALNAELDRFPHIRDRSDYPKLRADCEKYFKALQYRNALIRGEITFVAIADVINISRQQVRQWFVKDRQPHLLRLIDGECIKAIILHQLQQKNHRTTPSDAVLHAADVPEFRHLHLPPRTLTPDAVEILLNLRKDITDLGALTTIYDLTTYLQALRTFPLIQSHPRFDELHHQIKLFFKIRDNPPRYPDGRIAVAVLAKYAGISVSSIKKWIEGTKRPRLLFLLERRYLTITTHQQHVGELRELDKGIRTIHDLTRRIAPSRFIFSEDLFDYPSNTKHLNDATRYLAILKLVEDGHHPSDVETHFNLPLGSVGDTLRNHKRPYLIRIAARIPPHKLSQNLRWLPTITNASYTPDHYIQAPSRITDYKQLIPILENIITLTKCSTHIVLRLQEFGPSPALIEQWTNQFGPIQTLKEKLNAFAYIIGTTLSDGTISQQSIFSSQFTINLSNKYTWSRSFGNRVAYYLTSLGIPTKPGPDSPYGPNERYSKHHWWSVTSPFLTWLNRAVLGFKRGQTHTYTPAKIRWVLDASFSFQTKFIQGLFDGDGGSCVSTTILNLRTGPNSDVIEQLLLSMGIKTNRGLQGALIIAEQESIRRAVELPIYLSATGRLQMAQQVVEMLDNTRPSGKSIEDLPLIRRIQQLGQDSSLSLSQIRMIIFQEFSITIGQTTINSIIEQGDHRLKVDDHTVRSFFYLLELQRHMPDAPPWQVIRKTREETGTTKKSVSLYNWLRGAIPRDVKRALSDGHPISQELLEAYPHLRQYTPEERES